MTRDDYENDRNKACIDDGGNNDDMTVMMMSIITLMKMVRVMVRQW